MQDNVIQFYAPFGMVLYKAEEHNGRWEVYLQASNEGLDQEQEVLLCKALQDTKDYFLKHGVLSWDHLHKVKGDPKYIIGEPMDVAFNDQRETLVKGFLYQKNTIAQNLWGNIQSGAKRLGASVGGGILKKAKDGLTRILQVIWDECAITHKPVNDGTLGKVQVIPFVEFAKALMAGGGVDASAFSGGRSLIMESLQGADEEMDTSLGMNYEELRLLWDKLLANIMNGTFVSYNDIVQYILSQRYSDVITVKLIEFISNKMPGNSGAIY
jgi:hypothetical protein